MLITIDRPCSIEEPHGTISYVIYTDISYCDSAFYMVFQWQKLTCCILEGSRKVMDMKGVFVTCGLFSHPKDRYSNSVLFSCLCKYLFIPALHLCLVKDDKVYIKSTAGVCIFEHLGNS